VKIRLDYVSNSSSSSYVVSTHSDSPLDENMPLCESELFAYRDLRGLEKNEIVTGLAWYNGHISGNSLKVEIISCDNEMKPSTKSLFFYDISKDKDINEFISWLMGVSLSHNIVNLVNVSSEFIVSVAPSKDGDTNIDDHIIEEFLVRLGRTKDGEELKESDQ
jgi:hypothetical protein